MANDTIKIRVLNGAQFTERETNSKTVGSLRDELGLPATAEMSVNSVTVNTDHVLNEGDIVAATLDNKNGGCRMYILTDLSELKW